MFSVPSGRPRPAARKRITTMFLSAPPKHVEDKLTDQASGKRGQVTDNDGFAGESGPEQRSVLCTFVRSPMQLINLHLGTIWSVCLSLALNCSVRLY